MKFRKLRIAWSVGCAIACALVIVLWVRSYTWLDAVHCPTPRPLIMSSTRGVVGITAVPNDINTGWQAGWGWKSFDRVPNRLTNQSSWHWGSDQYTTHVRFPLWPLVVLLGVFAAVPWWWRLGWHFSLRTLLIVTTLVAVVLGAIVYAAH